MTCEECARRVEDALENVPGVSAVSVPAWHEGRAVVVTQDDVKADRLEGVLQDAGYGVSSWQDEKEAHAPAPQQAPAAQPSSSLETDYDLAVIGGGSAAFAAAIKASELGGQVLIVNDGLPIGGTCVNVGCIPSKTLLRAAEANHRSAHHGFEGISSESRVSNFKAVIDQKRALVASLRQAKYLDVVQGDPNISITRGQGRLSGEHTIDVDGQEISAASILIATGASPSVPPVPGLEETGYLTNASAYELEELPEHLIVLGGGYIGLENAQLFARLGSQVTVIEQMGQVLPTEDKALSDALAGYLSEEGITFHTGSATQSVRRQNSGVAVELEKDGQVLAAQGTHVLVATGRRGNTGGLGLEELGLETFGKGYLKVDDALRTSRPHIFGAGDVTGSEQFVYTAAQEGQVAAENALQGVSEEPDRSAVPWVVFTDPQVVGVGMDEDEAREAGLDVEVAELSLEHVPRAVAARDTRGFIRLMRDRESDRLVGARILAPEGSELLMELTLAIKYGITVRELTSTLHPYLTLSEGVKLAALTFEKDVGKLSCCAG